jgi:hypothetical protein
MDDWFCLCLCSHAGLWRSATEKSGCAKFKKKIRINKKICHFLKKIAVRVVLTDGKSALTTDSIRELFLSIEQKPDDKPDGQLSFEFIYD